MRQSISITGCVRWSVGRSVGRSVCGVTHSFGDPHVAPYWHTWPCFSSPLISFFSFLLSLLVLYFVIVFIFVFSCFFFLNVLLFTFFYYFLFHLPSIKTFFYLIDVTEDEFFLGRAEDGHGDEADVRMRGFRL